MSALLSAVDTHCFFNWAHINNFSKLYIRELQIDSDPDRNDCSSNTRRVSQVYCVVAPECNGLCEWNLQHSIVGMQCGGCGYWTVVQERVWISGLWMWGLWSGSICCCKKCHVSVIIWWRKALGTHPHYMKLWWVNSINDRQEDAEHTPHRDRWTNSCHWYDTWSVCKVFECTCSFLHMEIALEVEILQQMCFTS
jgi:hypothetical protein